MTKIKSNMSRGSEWHRWEPHIHAPGTVLSDKFRGPDSWDRYLAALQIAVPKIEALGITDYCVTDSYERVREEYAKGVLPGVKLLFPNIELRLDTATVKGNFVNIHLLVSPDDPDHIVELQRFLAKLKFKAHGEEFGCTSNDLRRLGRQAQGTTLSDRQALEAGCTQFKVSRDNLIEALRNSRWAKENILIAVAGNADGSSGLKEAADRTLREEIEKAAHAIFASSLKQRDFWLGKGAANRDELWSRYDGPKPCLWGSDAHDHDRIGLPDENRFCWLKGDVNFDTLRQACIIPERAYIGLEPPSSAANSQIIESVTINHKAWAVSPHISLNPGLVAIIGARGSGKTALADIIATGCDAYQEPAKRPSFLGRAQEYLSGSTVRLNWADESDPSIRPLDHPVNYSPEAYSRARYLSQQFVEDLCFIDGMPTLIKEIERVVYEAQPAEARDVASDFEELLEQKSASLRNARRRDEDALATISEEIGIELDKSRLVKSLEAQVAEKQKLIARFEADRKLLIPKGDTKAAARLSQLTIAAEKVRSYLRAFANKGAALEQIDSDVLNLRSNHAPAQLRAMKERYATVGLNDDNWLKFLLTFTGDVDSVISHQRSQVQKLISSWKGTPVSPPSDRTVPLIKEDADLEQVPLSLLEADIARLQTLIAADRDTANKLTAISRKISEETTSLAKLSDRLEDHQGAHERAKALVKSRQVTYERVFEAIVSEEAVLNELYKPIRDRLANEKGTLGKLTFTVTRVVDVDGWAKAGEDALFDLRTGPFRGIGSLAKTARAELLSAWQTGTAKVASDAMQAFRDAYADALLEKAKTPRTDSVKYRAWTRQFAQWLYSTDHISIEYGIQYDGIDIRKLSPGTRGIVLLLLYLALDESDDRPLIIDQPEENLDPQSVNDELVPLFLAAKAKRQVIVVTHNANLVVNTDADQIIIAEVGPHSGEGLPPITYRSGGLDQEDIRRLVCKYLEGGKEAFLERGRRLRIALQR